MDELDINILNSIQKEFPLSETPFAILADKLNKPEIEIISKIRHMKNHLRIIRSISASFNPSMIGYKSALIALNINTDDLNYVADAINKLPGVSHNYQRDNKYNIWFTLALPSGKCIESFVTSYLRSYKIKSLMILPSVKIFKLNANFNMSENKDETENSILKISENSENETVSDLNIELIKVLQSDLPIIFKPFDILARQVKISTEEFLDLTAEYVSKGIIRKYSANINHYKAGFNYNALIAWSINSTEIEEIGTRFAQKPFISHCYVRPDYPDWPYNLYTMLHAKSQDELNSNVDQMLEIAVNKQYTIMKTIKELKKEKVKYFI